VEQGAGLKEDLTVEDESLIFGELSKCSLERRLEILRDDADYLRGIV